MPKSYRKIQKNYEPGEVIFSENSICDGMYIINSGSVMVYKTIKSEDREKDIELTRIGERGMFGEMAVIDEQKRSASVKAVEATEVTIISKQMFDDQLSQLPPWVVTMIKLLVARIRQTNDKLRKIVDENQAGVDTGGLIVVDGKRDSSSEDGSALNSNAKNQFDETDQLLKDLDF